MPVELVSESDLRAALQPGRVEPHAFEAGIRARIEAGVVPLQEKDAQESTPLLNTAATFIPWPVAGGKLVSEGTQAASLPLSQKLLGYAALPAISLFLLVGTAFFSAMKIRKLQKTNSADISHEREMQAAVKQWWHSHKWPANLCFAAVILLPKVGATWILFLLLLSSFGLLLYLLSSFSRYGISNRLLIAQSSLFGLLFLGQVMLSPFTGRRDIHFVDQALIGVVLYLGTLILLPILISCKKRVEKNETLKHHWIGGVLYFSIVIPLITWITYSLVSPAMPSRILHYVENFETGWSPYIAFRDWEIPARWTIDQEMHPDLSRARNALMLQIRRNEQLLPVILGSAFRTGLVPPDQVATLPGLAKERRSLLPKQRLLPPRRVLSLNQYAWAFYALDQSGQLSPEDRDFLEQRLLATLEEAREETANVLETALRVTQLLEVIERPINRNQYRQQVHAWLRKFHTTEPFFSGATGGFVKYQGSTPSLLATSHAVELMQIYGIPEDLDLNWIRSFLHPRYLQTSHNKWIAAVSLDRLNQLSGAKPPSLLEWLYYERSLIASILLVGLCIYATLSAPLPALEVKKIEVSESTS